MPYVENDNVLFVHIPKNAGRSIEVALGMAKPAEVGNIGRRSVINRAFALGQRSTANRDVWARLYGTLDVTLCAAHLTLQEILLLGRIPREKVSNLRSFAVFRDPFERAVSTFMHFTGNLNPSPLDFEKFCSSWYFEHDGDHNLMAHRRQQIDFVLDCRGRVGVGKVLLFENLADELPRLCADWGLACKPLPHVGRQSTDSGVDGLYTARAKKIIQDYFADDIEFYRSIAHENGRR